MGALTAALFGFRRMLGSDYGLILKGISDNDRSVMNAGINIYWFKTQALFISSCIGAFSGAFMTHVYMFVGMPVFALDYSILPIAAAVVGGPGTLAGATLGAFIWCRYRKSYGVSAACVLSFTDYFWWSLSWRCPKVSSITFKANITNSRGGWRSNNEHSATAESIRSL